MCLGSRSRGSRSRAHSEAGDACSDFTYVGTRVGSVAWACVGVHAPAQLCSTTAAQPQALGPLFPQRRPPSHPRHPSRDALRRARLASRNGWLTTAERHHVHHLQAHRASLSACLLPQASRHQLYSAGGLCASSPPPQLFLQICLHVPSSEGAGSVATAPSFPRTTPSHAHPSRRRFMSPAFRARLVELHL